MGGKGLIEIATFRHPSPLLRNGSEGLVRDLGKMTGACIYNTLLTRPWLAKQLNKGIAFSTRYKHTMRLPYVSDPPNFTAEDDKAVEQRVRKRRGEKGLIALDRTLLHAPPVADGWYVSSCPEKAMHMLQITLLI